MKSAENRTITALKFAFYVGILPVGAVLFLGLIVSFFVS